MIPPAAHDAARKIRGRLRKMLAQFVVDIGNVMLHRNQPLCPWEGAYMHRRDVGESGRGFQEAAYRAAVRAETARVLHQAAVRSLIPVEVRGIRELVPFLAALEYSHHGRLSVLDFGGGMGLDYAMLIHALPDNVGIDYHIVDSAEVIREGRSLFLGDSRMHFHSLAPLRRTGHTLHQQCLAVRRRLCDGTEDALVFSPSFCSPCTARSR
jgi:hypothetical protein